MFELQEYGEYGRRRGSDRPRSSHGFALPMVLLAILLVGATAAAALVMTTDERRAAGAARESLIAFYAAESGIHEVRATWNDSVMGTLGPMDSVDLGWRVLENGSSYRAVIRRFDGGAQRIYGLTVEGRAPGSGRGQRELTFMMTDPRVPLYHEFHAAVTAIGGLRKQGTDGLISGHDLATSSDCPDGGTRSIPGVQTPDSSLWQGGSVITDSVGWLDGSVDFEWSGGPEDLSGSVKVDWEGVLQLTPDYDVQEAADFPASTAYGASWPIIFVADSLKLTGVQVPDGHGLIVGLGALDLEDGVGWDGLILVGDRLKTSGSVTIEGGLVTGLNAQLEQATDTTEIAAATIRYHSCNLRWAGVAAMNRGYRGSGPSPIRPFTTRAFSEVLR